MSPPDLRVISGNRDARARRLVESFQSVALQHLLALSNEHRPCPEDQRALCWFCGPWRRHVNAIADMRLPPAGGSA